MKFSYVSHTGVIPASRYQESPTFPFVSNFSSAEFIRTSHLRPGILTTKFSYVSHTGVIPASRYQESPTFPFVSNFSSAEFIRTRHHNPPLGLWICRAENESLSFWVLRSGLQLWKPNFLVFGPASLKKSILRVRPQRGYLFLRADCCTAVETTHLQNQPIGSVGTNWIRFQVCMIKW